MRILLILLFISFNSFSQELRYPESMVNFTKRPDGFKLDKVVINGQEYIGEILSSSDFLMIDLGNGEVITGSLKKSTDREVNYIIEDNRRTRKISFIVDDSKVEKNWIEAFPIINRKTIKNGFPVIIDDGNSISPLSGPDNNPLIINTPMSMLNLFEAMGYNFIKTEIRPTTSTPIASSEIGDLAASIVLGFDINNYEKNTIVYIFKMN